MQLTIFCRCHSITFLKLPVKITLVLISYLKRNILYCKFCFHQQINRLLKSTSLQQLLKLITSLLFYQLTQYRHRLVSIFCNFG